MIKKLKGVFIAIGIGFSLLCISSAFSAEDTGFPTKLRSAPTGTQITYNTAFVRNTMSTCIAALDAAFNYPVTITAQTTPWMSNGTTVNVNEMVYVSGNVWNGPSVFKTTLTSTSRNFKGNGLPNHKTGIYPVQQGTAAYSYYHAALGDNASHPTADLIPIGTYDLNITIPRNPVYSDTPSCMQGLIFGVVTQTHAVWHLNLANTQGQANQWVDPVAALPIDQCWGHPYNYEYHYHGLSWKCFPDQGRKKQHSPLFGYAMDGFGIYGPRGENGIQLTNANLDVCHGHKGWINWDGKSVYMYHYHVNNEFPYGPGCYRGTTQTYYDSFSAVNGASVRSTHQHWPTPKNINHKLGAIARDGYGDPLVH
jgi:hypothetical protein